jgi:hypothetical protein
MQTRGCRGWVGCIKQPLVGAENAYEPWGSMLRSRTRRSPAARGMTGFYCTPAQLLHLDAGHLAALTGLTSLAYGNRDEGMDPVGAISQLTRLRELRLRSPSMFSDAQLTQLSTLRRLTSLELVPGGNPVDARPASTIWLFTLCHCCRNHALKSSHPDAAMRSHRGH